MAWINIKTLLEVSGEKKIMKIASSLPWGLSRASLPDLNVPGWIENEEIICLGPAVHTVLGGASGLIMPGSEFFSKWFQQF